MICHCGGATYVTDSRPIENGQWRRRKCALCGEISTTLETLCETLPNPKGGDRRSGTRIAKAEKVSVARPVLTKTNKSRAAKTALARAAKSARKRIEDRMMEKEYE